MPFDPRVLELQTAKEILAEIFEIDVQNVEETIRLRCEDGRRTYLPVFHDEDIGALNGYCK
jgi:hypothetical protein